MKRFLLDTNAWRANGLCVVTRNVAEFSRVSGLLLENWQEMP